jgi:hypothetical protein
MRVYRKKPVVVTAIRWTGKNLAEVIGRGPLNCRMAEQRWEEYEALVKREGLYIPTIEGKLKADIGDYVITGAKGERYPCKPDIFAETYEAI